MKIEFFDPQEYSKNLPIHMAIYGRNGVGKTTFAADAKKTELKTVLLDCGDAGAVTVRKVPKHLLRIIKIHSILHYIEVIDWAIRSASQFDLLVVDTITGLQSIAIAEVKPKKTFDMNQRKWGQASSRMIECLSETRNFPKDVVYLVQERSKKADGEEAGEIVTGITPSVRGYLSSIVDWVGNLSIDSESKRFLDFRLKDGLEAKDRAGLFPKLIANPSYAPIRKRIIQQLIEGVTDGGSEEQTSSS